MIDSQAEISAGERFAFGRNWCDFTEIVDEPRIAAATASLTRALGREDLSECTFLDVGCGSGLFSLAAHRLGARVRAFDFDADSVMAVGELRRRTAPDGDWSVECASILDEDFVATLGRYDVVYCWGVLHHTGDMWRAMGLLSGLVAPGGRVFISIYNDQGFESRMWRAVKRRYNRSGPVARRALVFGSTLYLHRRRPLRRLLSLAGHPVSVPTPAPRERGMSHRHDLVDWVGGYPFEVAKPEEVFAFLQDRGFALCHLKTCGGGIGCNEYVFELPASPADLIASGGADGE